MTRYFIYAITDPRNRKIRYIGRSSIGLAEPQRYIADASKTVEYGDRYVHRALRKMINDGIEPKIEILGTLDDVPLEKMHDALNDAEIMAIAYYREQGYPLTNMTDGGDGITAPMLDAIREKISQTRKAGNYVSWTKLNGQTSETRAKISAKCKGRVQSQKEIDNRTASMKEYFSDISAREKHSRAHGGKAVNDICCQKTFISSSEASRLLGIPRTTLLRGIKEKRKVAGHIFEFST